MAISLTRDRLDEVLDAAAHKQAVVPSQFRHGLALISLRANEVEISGSPEQLGRRAQRP